MEGSIAVLGDFSTRPCALQLDKFLLVRGDFHSSSHIILYCTTSMQILELEVPCGRHGVGMLYNAFKYRLKTAFPLCGS